MDPDLKNLSETVEKVEDTLKGYNIKQKEVSKAVLLTEEMLVILAHNTDEGEKITVKIKKSYIELASKGTEIKSKAVDNMGIDLSAAEIHPDAENAIRNMLITANKERFYSKYSNGINHIKIYVGEKTQKALMVTLYSFLIAIVAGSLMRLFVPQNINSLLDEYIFDSVKTLFLNALNMIIGPLVFFSLASCVSTIKDLRELGKLGGKVMGFYVFTTAVAVGMGFLMFHLFNPGTFGEFVGIQTEEVTTEVTSISFKDTILGIVPSNIIDAFATSNTLQIIFLAIIVGVAAGMLGKYSDSVAEVLAKANALVLKIASLITWFLPAMIFSSMVSMIITADFSTFKSMFSVAIAMFAANFGMVVAYMLIVLIFAKTNPIAFIRKTFSAFINAFALSSSNAAMAHTMDVCDKKLGVSPKVYSFSIPLGATINMDGTSVVLTLTVLFFAKTFGITLTPSDYVSMIFTVIVLSMGCPGIPGAGMVCASVLLRQFGIPLDALAMIVGLYSVIDPLTTADNVMGDMTGTYVIAKRSGLVRKTDM